MNIRKAIDYTALYTALDSAVTANLPQMELYCEIGKVICDRIEKGAAVAAAEYLQKQCPDMAGFSPRNVRRMRDFYRLYSEQPELLAFTLQLNWTQNVVILESELSMEERAWCIRQAQKSNPSKVELLNLVKMLENKQNPLDQRDEYCYNSNDNNESSERKCNDENPFYLSWEYLS